MEHNTVRHTKDDGTFYTEETIRTTPEDGIVSEHTIRPAAMPTETYGKARMGYNTTKSFSTNNPKVTRPFVFIFCGIFLLIGIGLLFTRAKLMAIPFLFMSVFGFIKSNKQIDKVAEELEAQGVDTTIDSPEELKEVAAEVSDTFKQNFTEVAQETFTEKNTKNFTKKTLPIYAALVVIVSLVCGFIIHPVMGGFIFLLLTVFGIFYYCVLLKLITTLSKKKD